MLPSEFLTEQVWAGTGGFVVLTSFHMMLTSGDHTWEPLGPKEIYLTSEVYKP